jgi:hypothetical protein
MQKVFTSGFKFSLYLLRYLPTLFFWGIKVSKVEDNFAEIRIGYSWRTKNPFRSIYFSALAGAAELSTGILVLNAVSKYNMSILVVGVKGKFYKKATGTISFVCNDGEVIKNAIQRSVETNQGEIFTANTKGYNENKDIISEFELIWSVKPRN